jgi:hypothetical protein
LLLLGSFLIIIQFCILPVTYTQLDENEEEIARLHIKTDFSLSLHPLAIYLFLFLREISKQITRIVIARSR